MAYVFENKSSLNGIEDYAKKNNLALASPDCLMDFVNNQFVFVKGKDCELPTPTSKIGSGVTKRAVREMLKRYKDSTGGDSSMICCVDYGKEIFDAIFKSGAEGIRFYFALRNKTAGNDFMSLVLVGIDANGFEKVQDQLNDDEEAGKEVGHGTGFGGVQAAPAGKFKLAK